MNLPDIHHLSHEDQQLVVRSQQNVSFDKDTGGFIAIEPFADVLDKVGMHKEAREYFQKIISSDPDLLTQARCWRKIANSFISQRDSLNGNIASDNAVALLHKLPLQKKAEKEEYVRVLHQLAHSYYFLMKSENLEAITKEIKKYLPDITDVELRCNLLHVISLSVYTKYRWYQFPEEAFTHLELQLQLTENLENKFNHAYTHCILGHQYMFNEEFALSREHFSKAIQLLEGKHFGQLLIAYNYTAVGYRMQNNIAMTERWTNLTMEKASQTSNFFYVSFSYANLAWVYAKRNNWLYAEDYARKAGDNWSAVALTCSYAFPLIACLHRKDELEEAAELCFKLLHPRLKKFPDSLTQKLRIAVKAWMKADRDELRQALYETIEEANLTGYF